MHPTTLSVERARASKLAKASDGSGTGQGSFTLDASEIKAMGESEDNRDNTVGEFELKKRRPGCTGMFWRADPRGGGGGGSHNWPRDGAILRGIVHDIDGAKWLEASAVKQKGSEEWADTKSGSWLPFEYDNHYYLE